MTPKQISLVQSTWSSVVPIQDAAAAIFYDRLFAADPSLRALFKGDMQEQKRKLMTMIGTVVNGLPRLELVAPVIRAMGRRHNDYGVHPAHYGTVGTALLGTLEQGLGKAFTPEVKEAWAAAYDILAKTMQEAATA